MARVQLIAAAFALLLAGCSAMPRLVRLHDPLTPEEHMKLGMAYERQGEMAAAEREFGSVVRREPENVPAILAMGNAQFAQDKLKEAEKSFSRALRIVPGHPGASNNLAMTYLKRGRKLKQAELLAVGAQADERIRPYALDTLTQIYVKQGKLERAREMLASARAAAPPGDQAFLNQLQESERRLQQATDASHLEASP